MDIQVVVYVANVVVYTVIISMDIAIFIVAIKTGEIARQLILWTIFLCMGMDIAVYLNTVLHDVPSFFLDTDIFKTAEQAYLSILILCCQWFTQLFALLVLSVLHFIAVFSPAKFRTLLPRHMQMINLGIVLIGILFTVPLFTPYCGYTYLVQGHFWYFDMSKPYTFMYWSVNLVLQVICAAVVACVDTIIIWRICMIRRVATKRKAFTSSTATIVCTA
ncbi:unnamed protein product [Haemonchus placei]|uniref:7TM_GPCR_Srx domain-containing protein n=1 Tax=Haemonchus placei TaxID=6290 RepID=A0A0N4W4R8_HAEPC|nr:unnamed protein product [Haemonchus placei]